MRMRLVLAAALVLVATLAAACRAPEDPAQRYQRFAAAARGGEVGTVWALLSADSQQRIRERGKALTGGKPIPGVDLGPGQILLGDLAVTAPKVKSATVARASGDEAVVEVELEDGTRGQVQMKREKDGWKVVLPGG
jgi:hypothetical protein